MTIGLTLLAYFFSSSKFSSSARSVKVISVQLRHFIYMRLFPFVEPVKTVVQKVTSSLLTQLTKVIMYISFCYFLNVSCNWSAFGPAFLHRSYSTVEELLILDFLPEICHFQPSPFSIWKITV